MYVKKREKKYVFFCLEMKEVQSKKNEREKERKKWQHTI